MRSPAPMHNVALRWGGVGLSTYGTCSVDAVRPSCSTQAKKRLMVILLSMRQHDPSTGPQSPVRAGRQSARESRAVSGETRGGHTRPHSARAAPPPAAPATAHEPRRSTHGRSHTTHQPATGAGRRGRGGAGGGHVVYRPVRPSFSLNHVTARVPMHRKEPVRTPGNILSAGRSGWGLQLTRYCRRAVPAPSQCELEPWLLTLAQQSSLAPHAVPDPAGAALHHSLASCRMVAARGGTSS